jgi:hypothetical protein
MLDMETSIPSKVRRLGCQGLSEHEILVLRSMLRLFSSKGQTPWEIQEHEPFDAIVAPDERSELDADGLHSRLYIRSRAPAVTVNGDRRSNMDFITRPIRALPLFEKLSQIDAILTIHEPKVVHPSHEWADILIDHWGKEGGYLVKSATTKAIIFPKSRRFLPERADLSVADMVRTPVLSIKKIDDARAQQILRERRTRGLGWLGWYAGHHYPLDVLLVPTPSDELLQLRRWPDFGTLDHLPEYFNLAGLLNRYAMTIAQLIDAANMDERVVYRFLNACYLSGLLIEVKDKGWLSWLKRRYRPDGAERLSVIAAIRQRLGI